MLFSGFYIDTLITVQEHSSTILPCNLENLTGPLTWLKVTLEDGNLKNQQQITHENSNTNNNKRTIADTNGKFLYYSDVLATDEGFYFGQHLGDSGQLMEQCIVQLIVYGKFAI